MEKFERFGQLFHKIILSEQQQSPVSLDIGFPNSYKPIKLANQEKQGKKSKKNRISITVEGTNDVWKQNYVSRAWQSALVHDIILSNPLKINEFLWRKTSSDNSIYPIPLYQDFISRSPFRILTTFSPMLFFFEDWLLANLYAYKWSLDEYFTKLKSNENPQLKTLKDVCNENIFEQKTIAKVDYQKIDLENLLRSFVNSRTRLDANEKPVQNVVELKENIKTFLDSHDKSNPLTLENLPEIIIKNYIFPVEFNNFKNKKQIPEYDRVENNQKKEKIYLIAISGQIEFLLQQLSNIFYLPRLDTTTTGNTILQDLQEQRINYSYLLIMRNFQKITLQIQSSYCFNLDQFIMESFEGLFFDIYKIFKTQFKIHIEQIMNPYKSHKDSKGVYVFDDPKAKSTTIVEIELNSYLAIVIKVKELITLKIRAIQAKIDEIEKEIHQKLKPSKNSSFGMIWDNLWALHDNSIKRPDKNKDKNNNSDTSKTKIASEAKKLKEMLEQWLDSEDNLNALGKGFFSLCKSKHLLTSIITNLLPSILYENLDIKLDSKTSFGLKFDNNLPGEKVEIRDWKSSNLRTISSKELSLITKKSDEYNTQKLETHFTNPEELNICVKNIARYSSNLRTTKVEHDFYCRRLNYMVTAMWSNTIPYNNYRKLDDGKWEGKHLASIGSNPVPKIHSEKNVFEQIHADDTSSKDLSTTLNEFSEDITEVRETFETLASMLSSDTEQFSPDDIEAIVEDQDLTKDFFETISAKEEAAENNIQ